MKTLSIIILLATGLTFGAQAQYRKASLQATGLTCAMCSKATLTALKTLPFVDNIDTDLNATTFILHFKPDAHVNIDEIKNKVEDAGFSVGKLSLTADFKQVAVKNDTHVAFGGNTLHFMQVKDQVLNGEKELTVIDKDFIPSKQYKKFSTATTMPCYKTGVMADCCKHGTAVASNRIYHVTL